MSSEMIHPQWVVWEVNAILEEMFDWPRKTDGVACDACVKFALRLTDRLLYGDLRAKYSIRRVETTK